MEGLLGGSPTTQAAGDMARQFAMDQYGGVGFQGAVERRGAQIMDMLRAAEDSMSQFTRRHVHKVLCSLTHITDLFMLQAVAVFAIF
jgi:hypothetical protein